MSAVLVQLVVAQRSTAVALSCGSDLVGIPDHHLSWIHPRPAACEVVYSVLVRIYLGPDQRRVFPGSRKHLSAYIS